MMKDETMKKLRVTPLSLPSPRGEGGLGGALPETPRVDRAVQVTLLRTGYTGRDGVGAMRAVGSLFT